jgi:deoxyribodipyrimidine photo-lyase
MSKNYDIGIFIFRKDIRISDNRGLNKIAKVSKEIIPIFIFDPYQVELNTKNKNYLSFPALKFLCESLKELDTILIKKSSKLYIFYGKPVNVLKYIFKKIKSKYNKICLGFNEDFTKYSLIRDKELLDICLAQRKRKIVNLFDNYYNLLL